MASIASELIGIIYIFISNTNSCIFNWKQIQLESLKCELSSWLIICISFNGLSHHISQMVIDYIETILCASKLHVLDIVVKFCPDSWISCKTNAITPINSFWSSDTVWWERSGSALAQVMLVAWRHQAITWTNVDWSLVNSSDIHIRAISQEVPQQPITKICLKITYLKFHSNFPEVNEQKNKITYSNQ